MKVYENSNYQQDINYVANLDIPWEKLKNRTIMLSGASGLIGSCLIDVIMQKNQNGLNCKIYALGRNEKRIRTRFDYCMDSPMFAYIICDINKPLSRIDDISQIDYVIHLASNTHPMQYSTDPIGTITTNVFGVYNMLEVAKMYCATRFAFASSNEVYGENRGDVELFEESYCGYIDSNTLRAGYPESKRCGEAICQAYRKQKGLDIVIPRLTRSYGPTMLMSDSKAISQFICKAVKGEDIVLKSKGTQYYSYTYVCDAVAGILTVLLLGEDGQAYNVADITSDIMLKDMAEIIAKYVDRKVVFELPDVVEAEGYSKATKARLDGTKLHNLGWSAKYDIKSGLERTVDILKTLDVKE